MSEILKPFGAVSTLPEIGVPPLILTYPFEKLPCEMSDALPLKFNQPRQGGCLALGIDPHASSQA